MNKGSGFGAAVIEDSRQARAFFVDHLLRELVNRRIPVEIFEVASVPLEEIFITVVKEDRNE